MKNRLPLIASAFLLLASLNSRAGVKVDVNNIENDDATPAWAFKSVPPPSKNDAASGLKFTVVDGEADPNCGGVDTLTDGKMAQSDDEPENGFFFKQGPAGGRLALDLKSVISVKQINTYSWHTESRAPQVYKVYGSDGTAKDFNAAPGKDVDPAKAGWKLIAAVNTKPKIGYGSGQYGVSISNTGGVLGKFRYLLFVISPSGQDALNGNTLYEEIDVVDANGPAPVPAVEKTPPPKPDFVIKSPDGAYTIMINDAQSPDLKDWIEHTMAPVLAEWYPKIVRMLPGKGFNAPKEVRLNIEFTDGDAYTEGRTITSNSGYLENSLKGGAIGSVVREEVRVAQQITGHDTPEYPGWLIGGTAEYIRWFKFEPQRHGADAEYFKKHRITSPGYDDGGRGTANFLNWVTGKYDKNIVAELNAALREGMYKDDLWKKYTGRAVADLGAEWTKEIQAQLKTEETPPAPPKKEDATLVKQQQPAPAIPAAPETQPATAAQSRPGAQPSPAPQAVPAPVDHLLAPPKPEEVTAFADDVATPRNFTGVVVNLQKEKVMEFLSAGEVQPDDKDTGKWYALADLSLPDKILAKPETQAIKKQSEGMPNGRLIFNAQVSATGVLATKDRILFWTLWNDRVLRLTDETGRGCLLVLGPDAKPSAQFIDPSGEYDGMDSPWDDLYGQLPKIAGQDVAAFCNRPGGGMRSYIPKDVFTACLDHGQFIIQLSEFGGDMNPFAWKTKPPDQSTQNYRNRAGTFGGERNDSVACNGVLVTTGGTVVFWRFAAASALCLMDAEHHTALMLVRPPFDSNSREACSTQFPVDGTMRLSSIMRSAVLQGPDWPDGNPCPLDREKAVASAWQEFVRATGAKDVAGWRTGLVAATALAGTKFTKWYYTVRFVNQTTPGADATVYVGMDGTAGEINTVENGMKK